MKIRDRNIGKALSPVNKRKKLLATIKNDSIAWLLILPTLILFVAFSWEPLVAGIKLSFFKTAGFTAQEFVGFDNYITVIKDPFFLTALKNTFVYLFWSLLIGLFLPVVIAVMINEMRIIQSFFRFVVYFPNMVPGIATCIMWLLMMDPSDAGILNFLLNKIGISSFMWLNDPKYTIFLIVLTITWRGFGYTAILYLANLQSINTDLYEAASLDGAGIIKKAIHVTFPQMSGLIKLMAIMQIITILQIFDAPFTMTGGGPDNASLTIGMLTYNYGFSNFRFDLCAASGVIIMLILSVISVLYFRALRSNED